MMKYDDVIKLVNAGFTADQITAMMAERSAPEKKDPEPAEKAPEKQDPKPEVKEPAKKDNDILASIDERIKKFDELFDKLSKAPIIPTIGDVKPLGIDDVIRDFFKED